MKKIIGIRTIKTAIGAAIAMMISFALGLEFAVSAGIITILGIQSTKRSSVLLAGKRFLAAVMALVIGGIFFLLFGYTPLSFGLYLLVFIPIAARTQLTEGIVMASVLVTHMMSQQRVDGAFFINEMLLVIVGQGVALLLNLYMPSIEESLYTYRKNIEQHMFDLFKHMSYRLEKYDMCLNPEVFTTLESELEVAKKRAYKYSHNYLFAKPSPYEEYFAMRAKQLQVMYYMKEHFSKFFMSVEETKVVAKFASQVAHSIKGEIEAKDLLNELNALREAFKSSSLPKTREEFENRATLYQYLNDIEHFLQIKQDFREGLTQKELKEYLNGYSK